MRLSYIVPIWVTDRAPADLLLKISMLEFRKSWKLSHGLQFERSLSSSRFLRRQGISISPLLSTWKVDVLNGLLIFLMMKPGTIWFPVDAELPIRVKRTITSEKPMLIVFWWIHGIAHYCWLPKDNTLDSPFFCEEVFSSLAQKVQQNSKKLTNPWLWFIWTMQGQPKRHRMAPDSNTV
jgi:hypothetical protein